MGLVDDLAEKAGCERVSELRFHPEQYSLYSAVSSMPIGLYHEREWQEAVSYLASKDASPCDSETCKKLLLEHLSPNVPTES